MGKYLLMLLVFWSCSILADVNPPPPQRHYRDIHPVEGDVPYITCNTCKRLVRQVQTQIRDKKKKPTELDYLDAFKNLCDPLEEEGFWLTHLDLLPLEGKLSIKRMNGPGHCEEDCKTIAASCQAVLDIGDSEIAELLFLSKPGTSPESICSSSVFKSLRGSCAAGELTLSSNWFDRGSNFRHKTPKDFEREQKAAEALLNGGAEPKTEKGFSGFEGSSSKDGMVDFGNAGVMLDDGTDLGPLNQMEL